jgi:hypothetical protein
MRNAVAGLFLVVFTGLSSGQEPVRRLVWEHAEGLCRYADQGGGNWHEVAKDGSVSFRFIETSRNCDFVDLLDKGRGYTVRLYKDAMLMKGGDDGLQRFDDFTKYYDGRWVK